MNGHRLLKSLVSVFVGAACGLGGTACGGTQRCPGEIPVYSHELTKGEANALIDCKTAIGLTPASVAAHFRDGFYLTTTSNRGFSPSEAERVIHSDAGSVRVMTASFVRDGDLPYFLTFHFTNGRVDAVELAPNF